MWSTMWVTSLLPCVENMGVEIYNDINFTNGEILTGINN